MHKIKQTAETTQQHNKVVVVKVATLPTKAIGQSQSSNQNALCVSGTGTFVSCNNLNAQSQTNSGNNALAQQGGSGVEAEKVKVAAVTLPTKAIGQSQSSNQDSGVVSGGNTAGSGNNVNDQNQKNTGNNAAAQQVVVEVEVGGNVKPTKV